MRNTSAMKSILLAGLALLPSLTSTTLAQENQELGRMWTFENPPLVYLDEEYGFRPDQNWLASLRLGSLRLGGEDILSSFGSASFVSPEGLIMTSTRCVRDAVAATRPRDVDMIQTGFVAATREREFRLRSSHDEWLTAAQLVKISNVTDEINRGVAPTANATQIQKTRIANKKRILDAARKTDPNLVPQIVSLYQGGVSQLYQYKMFNDLRLVCIPHLQTAHFGGDPDNFTYPRYSIDFAFLRAYEDGKHADTTTRYFKWKSGGAKKDELVFVSGNPGVTQRLFTKAQLEFERDIKIPLRIEPIANRLHHEKNAGALDFDPEHPSQNWAWAQTGILELEDALKAARGNLSGLEDATLMAQKTAAEKAFQYRVMADKKLAQRYGDLWDRIASAVEVRRQHETRARFQTANAAAVLGVAVAIVRLSDPAETEAHREQARKTLGSLAGRTIKPNAGLIAACVDHVVRAHKWLPKDDPYLSNVLAGRSAEGWPARLPEYLDAMEGEQARSSPNWIGYPEPREALVKSGWKAIQNSDDPAIVAARACHFDAKERGARRRTRRERRSPPN